LPVLFNYFKKEIPKTDNILNNRKLRTEIGFKIEKMKALDLDEISDSEIFNLKIDAGVTDDILEREYGFTFPVKTIANDPITRKNTTKKIDEMKETIFKEIYEKNPDVKVNIYIDDDLNLKTDIDDKSINRNKLRKEINEKLKNKDMIKNVLKEKGISDDDISLLLE
jgi:dephospho-CoA kinase